MAGSFKITLNTFIGANENFFTGYEASIYPEVDGTGTPPYKLNYVGFYPAWEGQDYINFTFDEDPPTDTNSFAIYYMFELGAFGKIGEYNTLGLAGVGHLTVSQTGVPAVPEPATMLLLGLGLMGIAGVRRKFKK